MVQYFDIDQEQELMLESRKTLERLEEKNKKKIPLIEQMQKDRSIMDKGKDLYEEYSEDTFNYKSKVDLLYYNQLLQNLDESLVEKVEQLIIENIKLIKEIYKSINTNPVCFKQSKLTDNFLEESINVQQSIISKNIYEFLNLNFYNLDPQKRQKKYLPLCTESSKKLISEGMDPKEAVEFSIKKHLIYALLDDIAFPKIIKHRLNYLLESDLYGKIFDQDELKTIFKKYQKLTESIASIITTCI